MKGCVYAIRSTGRKGLRFYHSICEKKSDHKLLKASGVEIFHYKTFLFISFISIFELSPKKLSTLYFRYFIVLEYCNFSKSLFFYHCIFHNPG